MPSNIGSAMAYDNRRRRTVQSGAGPQTWEFGSPLSGQPGGGLPMVALTVPRVGASYCLAFKNSSPNAVGLNLLMAALAPPVTPPFTVQPPAVCATALPHLVPGIVLSVSGNPAFPCLQVPAVPALAGAFVTVQAASLEQGLCFRATDALDAQIQP